MNFSKVELPLQLNMFVFNLSQSGFVFLAYLSHFYLLN